jgi:hypothetical protein
MSIKAWFPIEEDLDEIKKKTNYNSNHGWRLVNEINGAFNRVKTYIGSDQSKISIRTSMKPVYYLGAENVLYNANFIPFTEEEKQEVINNKKNWHSASQHKISPELYYYGYYKGRTGSVRKKRFTEIHLCIISQGYDTDLETYYDDLKKTLYRGVRQPNPEARTLSDTDKYIADQLVQLLQKTTKEMGTICFDLKPANCVINTSTYEVKLIDWDEDWCKSYNFLTKKDKSIAKLTGLLSTVFMANQFLRWSGWNIFAAYFTEKKYNSLLKEGDTFYRRPLIPSLKTLYCSPMKTTKGSGNRVMTLNYQFTHIEPLFDGEKSLPDEGSDVKTKRLFKKKCNKIFELLWERTLLLKENVTYESTMGGGKTKGKHGKRTKQKKIKRGKKTRRRTRRKTK